jgi:hypothetical protein
MIARGKKVIREVVGNPEKFGKAMTYEIIKIYTVYKFLYRYGLCT